jgi:hypothetical protein
MKSPDIIEVTLKVIRVLEKLGIAYHIGGSLASSAFGIARSTLDVDIVADIRPEQATAISGYLGEEFYVDSEMILDAIKRESSFNLIHLETLFKVDIFVVKHDPFDQLAFSRRIRKSLSEADSQELFFATPEDIILRKLLWYKEGEQVSDRQWKDVLGVLKVQGEELDMTYLSRWAEHLGVVELLKRAVEEAGMVGEQ